MRRTLGIFTLIAATVLVTVPASAGPLMGCGMARRSASPVLLSPYWISRCRHGVHRLTRPGLFQLRLSEVHGCTAYGPGTFITMSHWAWWDQTDAYGYGRWQSGIARVRVWVHRPISSHFSRITIRTAPDFEADVTYARWSWDRKQWVLST